LKLSLLFFDYLVQNKELNLQGIGHFSLDETVLKTPEQESEGILIVPGSIRFQLDKKVVPDEKLISFISKETGKIKPLASSDLDSYIELGKQLININKPFILEGIGLLQKNGQNQLEFVEDRPGHDLRYSLDSSKIKVLGWKPRQNFEEALKKTVEWYRINERLWRPLATDEVLHQTPWKLQW